MIDSRHDPVAQFTEEQIQRLLDMIHQLECGNFVMQDVPSSENLHFNLMVQHINSLTNKLQVGFSINSEVEHWLNQMLSTIMALAAFDFSKKVSLRGTLDVFDGLAAGINMLGEELHSATLAKNFMDSIINAMVESLVITDSNEQIIKINPATNTLLGYKGTELIGKQFSSICPILHDSLSSLSDDHPPHSYTFLDRIKETGNLRNIDTEYKNKSGELIPVSFSCSFLKDSENHINGFVGIAWDMRESKLLRELQHTYKDLVETTTQLVQTEKLSALGELTAGVAHELNQPLNGIKIISQSILRDIQRNRFNLPSATQDINDVVSLVNKMAEIINHMRVFSRNTEGLLAEKVDVNTTIQSPLILLEQQIKNHGIRIIKNLKSDLPIILGDSIRLEQVVMNLITNARNVLNTTDIENKTIELRTYFLSKEESPLHKNSVVMEVTDNGAGIPDEIHFKIFQPFFTTSKPGKGTGLGLSVSRKIVEEHHGVLSFESHIGKGTRFFVVLPAL